MRTPLWTGVTLFVSGIGFSYYSIYITQKEYKSTELYQTSIMHLKNYDPVLEYVGDPISIKRVEMAEYTDNNVTMVIPFRGPKGKAKLIVNGVRGASNEVILDHLDVELSRSKKTWTFFKAQNTDIVSQPKSLNCESESKLPEGHLVKCGS
ncbi:hypothetical protein EB796_019711 [Bugula neritina]|uniref:COA1 n=1 Tax=Bugula neritina TaxID=10212 RepID=A0A7J7J8B7_BUGNE|nr:hypothetical protein EB796_019711 [Bugula neritina]